MTKLVANDHCTCAEVCGEDPDCKLHGVETDWAIENTLAADWQNMVLEYRIVIADLERQRTPEPSKWLNSFTQPYAAAGHDVDSLFDPAGNNTCARCGAAQIDLSEDRGYGSMRQCSTPEPSVNAGLADERDAYLSRMLNALAFDCENTDGWEGAASDLKEAAMRLAALSVVTIPDEKGVLDPVAQSIIERFTPCIVNEWSTCVVDLEQMRRILAALRASPSPSIREGVLEEAAKAAQFIRDNDVWTSASAETADRIVAAIRALKNPPETKGGGL